MNTTENKVKYDLEERTAISGESIIRLIRTIKPNHINLPLTNQLIRSATSIGANYMEATGAESKSDFKHKISICKKESKETKHFLRMLVVAESELSPILRKLWQEAQELTLIFSAITRNTKK